MANDMYAAIRHILSRRGLSREAQEFVTKCRAKSTLKGKFYKWRGWVRYAREKKVCPFDWNSAEAANFISVHATKKSTGGGPAKQGSETFSFMQKFTVEFQSIMRLLVDAAYHEKPARVRRLRALDITDLFQYLHDLGPCKSLGYHALRDRAAILLKIDMLGVRQCETNLHRKKIEFLYDEGDQKNHPKSEKDLFPFAVRVQIFRGKVWRPGHPDYGVPHTILAEKFQKSLYCSTPHNLAHLQAREILEGRHSDKIWHGVFPSITREPPANGVLQPSTFAKIIANTFEKAEIIGFTPGDIRAAASTKCYLEGVVTRKILNRAGWKTEAVFMKHYRKRTDQDPLEQCQDLSIEKALRKITPLRIRPRNS